MERIHVHSPRFLKHITLYVPFIWKMRPLVPLPSAYCVIQYIGIILCTLLIGEYLVSCGLWGCALITVLTGIFICGLKTCLLLHTVVPRWQLCEVPDVYLADKSLLNSCIVWNTYNTTQGYSIYVLWKTACSMASKLLFKWSESWVLDDENRSEIIKFTFDLFEVHKY